MNPKQKNKEEKEDEEINNLILGLMEGYRDSVIPPLSDLVPLHEAAGTAAIENPRSSKIEKRDKMKENFEVLQTMVPNLLPKASRERIVHETISHIGFLKQEIERLVEMKKKKISSSSSSSMVAKGKMPMYSNWNSTSSSSSINVTVCGNVVFFGIRAAARKKLATEIFKVFHKHGAQVLAGNVAVNHGQLTLTVTAFVDGNKDSVVEKIKRDILVL